MSSVASLASAEVGPGFHDPSSYESFFEPSDRRNIEDKLTKPREAIPIGQPGKSCESNLFFGFFFDGTRNNYAESEAAGNHTHSNVARLFDAYPGQTIAPAVMLTPKVKWPDEGSYPNYFRIYAPGVGTPFDEVGDTGKGMDRTMGAAVARWGERRLVWSLGQAINALHRYFYKAPLLSSAELLSLAQLVDIDRRNLRDSPRFMQLNGRGPQPVNTKARLQEILVRLHTALKPHMRPQGIGQPAKVDPGIVNNIYVSAFGFSRGSAAARAFTNWFMALCQIDAQMLGLSGPSLGGFPVTFDFLGIFDTVASVGLAASSLVADGHGAWADAEVSLRIPDGIKCTHLVSAHEVRRSFPLDSISVGGSLADGCQEIVFPGVHSDVGGGYVPKEQGRGLDSEGADMLSRIPLAVMYREARLNGAPMKLERTRQFVKDKFKIAPATVAAFNDYIKASEAYAKAHPRTGMTALRAIMRTQMELAILWRKRWAGRMAQMGSVAHAEQVDRNDIVSADQEFQDEMRRFATWQKQKGQTRTVCPDAALGACMSVENRSVPGLDSGRFDEWEDMSDFWARDDVPAPVAQLFESLAHDSRAWFKLTGWEASEVKEGLEKWTKEYDAYQANNHLFNDSWGQPQTPPFSAAEEAWIKQYKATGKIPEMETSGREPFVLGAGYLRFRRIYAGGDKIRLTHQQTSVESPAA